MRLSALNRKLLRDLWELRGQGLAIAAVMAAGVAMAVTYLSNLDSLQRSRDRYFARQRFADVFASVTRAPAALAGRLAAIPGVEAVDTRVVVDVTLDVPGLAEPATGRLVSVPDRGEPRLNALALRRGRWIDPAERDEALVSESFVDANHLAPGDRLGALVNGRYRELTIVGVVLSPEYVYSVRPGEMISDSRRFGVLWLSRTALAAAFDMEGSFNDVALKLTAAASNQRVIAAADRLLAPFGGMGATPRDRQVSAWTLENELGQLRMFGILTPAIFLSVAAFVLHVALTRALALQRGQIAALKAIGYGNAALAWHYVKFAIVIAVGGAGVGVAAGRWLGVAMIGLYNQYFRFPVLEYRLATGVAVGAVLGSALVGALGAQAAVRRAVRIPPAEAMRPDGPVVYVRSVIERWPSMAGRMPIVARMIARAIERQPARALLSTVGIALAAAVLIVGLSFLDIMRVLIDEQIGGTMRQDATVTLVQPRSSAALHALARLPGVLEVEALRSVPVRLRSGHHQRTVMLAGAEASPRLQRILDRAGHSHRVPAHGVMLSAMLGEVLEVREGDVVEVEVLTRRQPVRRLRVAALVDDTLGLQASVDMDSLRRLLGEGPTISGAYLTLDAARLDAFYRTVKGLPMVASVALRDVMVGNFRDAMAETMNLSVSVNVGFAAIIAIGVVYNAARVSLSERARDLASLRVLGFTRGEVSAILLGELAVLTVAALPLGTALGYALGALVMQAFNNEIYRLSFVVRAATVAWAWVAVLGATTMAALLVRRRIDRLDLIAVLKARD